MLVLWYPLKFHYSFCSFLPQGGDDEDDDEPQADAVDYIAKFEVANDRSESPLTVPMQKQVSYHGSIYESITHMRPVLTK